MSLEITNLEEFKDKFAALMAANVSMITAGIEPSASLSSKMIDEFVMQFMIATPMPATPLSAGWVVIGTLSGDIPSDFKGKTYETNADAQLAVSTFIGRKGYGRTSDYRIVKATYFA